VREVQHLGSVRDAHDSSQQRQVLSLSNCIIRCCEISFQVSIYTLEWYIRSGCPERGLPDGNIINCF
jgi:hypothetical protein